jgi:hypothetical protein
MVTVIYLSVIEIHKRHCLWAFELHFLSACQKHCLCGIVARNRGLFPYFQCILYPYKESWPLTHFYSAQCMAMSAGRRAPLVAVSRFAGDRYPCNTNQCTDIHSIPLKLLESATPYRATISKDNPTSRQPKEHRPPEILRWCCATCATILTSSHRH